MGDSLTKLTKQACVNSKYKNKRSFVEVNVNQAQHSNDGTSGFIKFDIFGNQTKEAVDNLVSRVCGTEEPKHNAFISASIKLKDGFEDKHNIINRLNKHPNLKDLPFKPKISLRMGCMGKWHSC